MNYEFHVGDYVETKCGHIGYVSKINQLSNGHNMLYICYTDGKTFPCDVVDHDVEHRFVRIGQYDFTKQKEIKRVPSYGWGMSVSGDNLIDKINELVDAVNKLRCINGK